MFFYLFLKKIIEINLMNVYNVMEIIFWRCTMYRILKAGEQVEGLKYDFSKAVPHYLMYTTTGRADLIMFESSFQKRKKEYEKMMQGL